MRRWTARFRFVAAALAGPALILPVVNLPAMAQSATENAALDALFAQLRLAQDPASAQAITNQIWVYWTTPADPMLAGHMRDVLALRQRADLPAAITLLNQIVAEYPDYAEAWNQRATIHYLLRDFDSSMADIDKVLALEPRHFGALVGRAVMYRQQGEDDLAIADMVAALAIHPFLVERAMFPELDSLVRI